MSDTSIDTATGKSAPAELSTNRVKTIFSTIADDYERFNVFSSLGVYKRWLRQLAKMTPISRADTVLDVAGGTGDVTFTIAQQCHPAAIICSDLVPEMLAIAQSRYEAGEADGVPVTFQTVDAQSMPFDDASFDVVTVAYGIRNMPKREQALHEIFRVLKPGGIFVCLDFSTPKNPIWHSLYQFYLHHMIPFWGAHIAGKENRDDFVYLARSIEAFPNQETFATMLSDTGFTNVTWRNCSGGIACIHRAFKPF